MIIVISVHVSNGLKTMRFQVQIPKKPNTLGDCTPSVQALVDRVTQYLCWWVVGGSRYPWNLVKVRASYLKHHSYVKKKEKCEHISGSKGSQ